MALLAHFFWEQLEVRGAAMAVNYGLERVRFPAPVIVGSRLRSVGRRDEVRTLDNGWIRLVITQTVEIEGAAKPACVAVTLTRVLWS